MAIILQRWYAESNNDIVLEGLRDRVTGLLLSAATVTAEVRTVLGVVIAGSQISLTPVVGVAGSYQGTEPDTLGLQVGFKYDVVVRANAGAGKVRTFRERVRVELT